MSDIVTELNNYVTIRSFENAKGETVKYIAGPDLKSAKPNNLLRAMIEKGITAKELLQMVETPKKTASKGRAVGNAVGIQPVVDKLKSLPESKQIVLLSRLSEEQARLVDLNLRGKKGSNSGPKMNPVKVLSTILNSLGLEYQVTPDLEMIKVGLESDLYFDDLLAGL